MLLRFRLLFPLVRLLSLLGLGLAFFSPLRTLLLYLTLLLPVSRSLGLSALSLLSKLVSLKLLGFRPLLPKPRDPRYV